MCECGSTYKRQQQQGQRQRLGQLAGAIGTTRINLATTPATRRCKLHKQLGWQSCRQRRIQLPLCLSRCCSFCSQLRLALCVCVCVCVIPVAADWSDNSKSHSHAVLSQSCVPVCVCVYMFRSLSARESFQVCCVCVCVRERESEADERRVLARFCLF